MFCFSPHLSYLTRMDKDLHKVVTALYLPLFSEMPSQQGVFPKRSLGKNPKIDHFSPTTKPHPLNPLTEGLPFLYWLGTRGGALALLCAFHYPLHLSSFTPTPFLLFLPCLILLFLPCLILLCVFYVHAYPPWHGGCGLFGLDIGLVEVPAHVVRWAFALITSLPTMPMDPLATIPAMLAH